MRYVYLRTKVGYRWEKAYRVNELSLPNETELEFIQYKKKKQVYLLCPDIVTFDIETTTYDKCGTPNGFMYIWQACVFGQCVYGRTWQEFISLLKRLIYTYRLDEHINLLIYVHNLGFEFQFMNDFLSQEFGEPKIFASQKRKPIYVKYPCGIEFRCSWKLSNMSLAKFCENELGCDYLKSEGDLDYRKMRTPYTYIDDCELSYAIGDVKCLYHAVMAKMKNEEDSAKTIPYTNTGYIRRDCRNNCRKDKGYRGRFLRTRIYPKHYELLKEASRGGDTHASRYYSGHIVNDVDSYDFQSDYPAQMLLQKFPVSTFTKYGIPDSIRELEKLFEKYACLFRVGFEKLSVKDGYPAPYIPYSKCNVKINVAQDNGRVLTADKLSMTVTDIDWQIIKDMYTWDEVYLSDVYISTYNYLPKALTDSVMHFFTLKTEIKSQMKKTKNVEKLENLAYLYAKSKNRLNSIFGMCFTDPVHDQITYNGTWDIDRPDIADSLERFYSNWNSFLSYAWGVWVTAHARMHLHKFSSAIGGHELYRDTDSCKGFGFDKKAVELFNKEVMELCENREAYVDCDGKRYYLGIAECETERESYKQFISLGAKKYCYMGADGLHLTISGVRKKDGAKELKIIENFKPHFVFNKSAGLDCWYNDTHLIETLNFGDGDFQTASNVGMRESEYTIGITDEYSRLIGWSKNYE